MTYKVYGHKFHDMDRLNNQIMKVMRRYGYQFGYFEIEKDMRKKVL